MLFTFWRYLYVGEDVVVGWEILGRTNMSTSWRVPLWSLYCSRWRWAAWWWNIRMKYQYVYHNVTSCAFSLVLDRDLLKDAHRWRQIHVRSRQRTKQIDNYFPCVYCNRLQNTSQRVKNNSHATRLRLVSRSFFVLYTLWNHLWSITVHTHGKVLSIC